MWARLSGTPDTSESPSPQPQAAPTGFTMVQVKAGYSPCSARHGARFQLLDSVVAGGCQSTAAGGDPPLGGLLPRPGRPPPHPSRFSSSSADIPADRLGSAPTWDSPARQGDTRAATTTGAGQPSRPGPRVERSARPAPGALAIAGSDSDSQKLADSDSREATRTRRTRASRGTGARARGRSAVATPSQASSLRSRFGSELRGPIYI
jgi:hypothetical protein